MPLAVYVLGIGIFALITSEYMVSGLILSLAADFGVSVVAIGYLVTAYAGAMAVGGPVLTVGLLKMSRKSALLMLISVFLAGQVLGALSPSYQVMLVARLVTGIAAAAFFGVALTTCAELVGPQLQGRASSIVLGGLMVGTVFGLPAATLVGEYFGWRVSFWAVAAVALVAGLAVLKVIPATARPESVSIRTELTAFRQGKLWAVFTTSLLLIGATFAAFTYFVPILTGVSGFAVAMVPLLLVVYGLATIVGNYVVGRLADRFTIPVLAVGFVALIVGLVVFALSAHNPVISVLIVIVIGLTGVSMNPALVTRGMLASNGSPLVNTVHTAFIMLGVVVGSWIGGLGISAGFGLVAPLWLGAGLAMLGLLSIVPELYQLYSRRTDVAVGNS